MIPFEPFLAPPPYTDLDEANKEVRRLQRQLFNYNQRLATVVEKAELTKRSLKGIIKALRAEIKALQAKVDNAPK